MFIETAKFRSSFSILDRKSCGMLAMSAHALLFVKNSNKGKLLRRKSRVNDTQLPSTFAPVFPTVGAEDLRHATYNAHPIH